MATRRRGHHGVDPVQLGRGQHRRVTVHRHGAAAAAGGRDAWRRPGRPRSPPRLIGQRGRRSRRPARPGTPRGPGPCSRPAGRPSAPAPARCPAGSRRPGCSRAAPGAAGAVSAASADRIRPSTASRLLMTDLAMGLAPTIAGTSASAGRAGPCCASTPTPGQGRCLILRSLPADQSPGRAGLLGGGEPLAVAHHPGRRLHRRVPAARDRPCPRSASTARPRSSTSMVGMSIFTGQASKQAPHSDGGVRQGRVHVVVPVTSR